MTTDERLDTTNGTPPVRLTEREREVLAMIGQGHTSQEVADKLFLSKRTVDFHLQNIYHKLNVKSRVQAVLEAMRRGLLPGP